MTAVVVGGGLAGLVTARRLALAGSDVTVLEAAPKPGGMIGSVRVGDVDVDSGAEAYAVRGGGVRALCEELGLSVAPPRGKPHVHFDEGVFPMAEGVLGIPAAADDPALEALNREQREEALKDLALCPGVGADSVTVADLVRARMGQATLERLVTPVTQSIYGVSPDRLVLADIAPGLLGAMTQHGSLLAAVAAIRSPGAAVVEQPIGGMFQLVNALTEAIATAGGQVRTGAAVVGLRRQGSGYGVSLRDGETVQADRVILAGPAALASGLLRQLSVDVSAPALRESRVVVLAVDHPDLLSAPVGSGTIVARPVDALAPRALTQYSVKWPWALVEGVSVLRVAYSGVAIPSREEAVAAAARLTGVDLRDRHVVGVASVGWAAMPTRIEASSRDYLVGAAASAGIDLVGAWLDGNGIASVIAGCERVRS